MKHLSIFIFASCALMINFCGRGNNAPAASITTAYKLKPAGSGKGTITCIIDGKPASFAVQSGFFEIRLDVESKGPKDGLELLDGSSKKEGFQFEIKNAGTTNIKGGTNGCIINYYNQSGLVYTGSEVIVTISSFNGDHLTGTFAGQFLRWDSDQKIIMQITDGKFDLLK